MQTVYLDLEKMHSPDDFHSHIATLLNFPHFYRHNLDSLYDRLIEIEEETEIVFPQAAAAPEYLGDYVKKLLATLEDAAEENDELTITWK